MPPRHPTQPEFTFDLTPEAAAKNYLVLMKKYIGDLGALLEVQRNSIVGYGSEFRDVDTLRKIFGWHPNWTRMSKILENGSEWPLEPLDEELRCDDVDAALAFGNHKGVSLQPDLLQKLVSKDVHFGYCLPLPLDKAQKIPGTLLAPMNIQKQNTINKYGRIIEKDHLTHDQSYKWLSGTFVNSRMITYNLLLCMFGACIKRIVNWTVSARQKFPKSHILASKFDFKSAFQRCHLNVASAMQTCTQLVEINILLMMLRLSFGGKPCPFEWDVIFESICDVANDILHDNSWDPYDLTTPNQQLVPERMLLDNSIPFAHGLELIVNILINPQGIHDIYNDDIVNLTIDIPGTDHVAHAKGAALLAMDATARPNHPEEPTPRESMDAMGKLKAEAGPVESKVILGWNFDFR